MRVLVCGSRTYTDDHEILKFVLDGIFDDKSSWNEPVYIIHGAAPGADTCAADFCFPHVHGLIEEPYPANWDTYGRAAGPIRNQQMLDEAQPDIVLAFIDKRLEESRGTWDMVRRATKAEVPTYVIRRMKGKA